MKQAHSHSIYIHEIQCLLDCFIGNAAGSGEYMEETFFLVNFSRKQSPIIPCENIGNRIDGFVINSRSNIHVVNLAITQNKFP